MFCVQAKRTCLDAMGLGALFLPFVSAFQLSFYVCACHQISDLAIDALLFVLLVSCSTDSFLVLRAKFIETWDNLHGSPGEKAIFIS